MNVDVAMLARLSKEELIAHFADGSVMQSGGEVIDSNFELPSVETNVAGALPSIVTFIVSAKRTISSTSDDDGLNAAWMPAVDRLVTTMMDWAHDADIELTGDAYVTVSVTNAHLVNGEAHFDDAQYEPGAGSGLVAVVGDLDGPSAASTPIPHVPVRPNQSLTVSNEMKDDFAGGAFGRVDYGANQLVALPQFGQLHSGPGPCGGQAEVRHLMVFRASTVPSL